MYDKPFFDTKSLAVRWGCEESTLRNARPEKLPARFVRPGSRLVLFPLTEVLAYEKAYTEARDYEAERKLGAAPVFGNRGRQAQCRKGGRP